MHKTLGLLLASLLVCASAIAGEPDAMLWRASQPGFSLYLFGTTHDQTDPDAKLPAHVIRAMEDSPIVLVEYTSTPGVAPALLPPSLAAIRRNYAAQGYAIDPATRQRLDDLVQQGALQRDYVHGILHQAPLGLLWSMRARILKNRMASGEHIPWVDSERHRTGTPYDRQVMEQAMARGKQLIQLDHPRIIHFLWIAHCENQANNSALIDSELDAAADDDYTRHGIGRNARTLAGDYEQLVADEHRFETKYRGAKLFVECQHTPRNHFWMDRIAQLRQWHGGSSYFLVAGSRHFMPESATKDESLLDLLARQGYTLERVRAAR